MWENIIPHSWQRLAFFILFMANIINSIILTSHSKVQPSFYSIQLFTWNSEEINIIETVMKAYNWKSLWSGAVMFCGMSAFVLLWENDKVKNIKGIDCILLYSSEILFSLWLMLIHFIIWNSTWWSTRYLKKSWKGKMKSIYKYATTERKIYISVKLFTLNL
jgi:hypothetical protein